MKTPRPSRSTSAVVVVVDGQSAVISRCANGTFVRVETVLVPEPRGSSDHMGDAPHRTFHAGTRGQTATDASAHAHRAARDAFIASLSRVVTDAAGAAEWIVIGGAAKYVNAVRDRLITFHARNPVAAAGLHRGLSVRAATSRVARAIASRIDTRDLGDVFALLERTGAHTTGVVGPIAVLDAAERGAAEIVFWSPAYIRQNPGAAAQLHAAVIAHHGEVVEVAGLAAELIDERAGGVGALLRYSMHAVREPVHA